MPQPSPADSFAKRFPALTLRPVTDADGPAMAALVGGCYAEYDGMVLELDGEDSDLPTPATAYAAKGGSLWVVTDARGTVIASVGVRPSTDAPDAWELKRMYVTAAARRQGLAAALLGFAENEARRRGADRMTLWSDTRLTDAHRFYERHGYTRGTQTRELNDLSNSIEYFFDRRLV